MDFWGKSSVGPFIEMHTSKTQTTEKHITDSSQNTGVGIADSVSQKSVNDDVNINGPAKSATKAG
jgi:hypothetical protein